MMTSTHDDTLFIGGGVIGVCVACYLARQNKPVTLVKRDIIGD